MIKLGPEVVRCAGCTEVLAEPRAKSGGGPIKEFCGSSCDLYRAERCSRSTDEDEVPRISDRRSLRALALYLVLSIVFFGRGLIGRFGSAYVGMGIDPTLMAWFLVWWLDIVLQDIISLPRKPEPVASRQRSLLTSD